MLSSLFRKPAPAPAPAPANRQPSVPIRFNHGQSADLKPLTLGLLQAIGNPATGICLDAHVCQDAPEVLRALRQMVEDELGPDEAAGAFTAATGLDGTLQAVGSLLERHRAEARQVFEQGLDASRREQALAPPDVERFAWACLEDRIAEALGRHREEVWAQKEADLRDWQPRRSTQAISASLRPLGDHVIYPLGPVRPELTPAYRARLLADMRQALKAQGSRTQETLSPVEVAEVVQRVVNGPPHALGLAPIRALQSGADPDGNTGR